MKINVFNIARELPKPIKKPLSWIYERWNLRWDEETINNLKEYFNLDRKKVMRLLKSSGRISADFWFCLRPRRPEEIKRFYAINPLYIFNLIFWHSTKYQRDLRVKIINLAQGKVLDYGAGVGDLCLKIAEKGLKVDYADLGGETFRFAKWLFKKKNYNIRMIDLDKNEISEKYDTILCIDVIEHVVDPKALLGNLAAHLNDNGKLIITALKPDISGELPMHFEMKFNPEEYLKSLGMVETKEPFLWIKPAKNF